ncbi:MAG: undecaprenyldiphospho-muramoylpentapeptide beta-N-acetylglucosaminyltransferase [Endozoicomonas sp.]
MANQSTLQAPVMMIMAGGTGGHIFPGLATARALENAGYRVHWLGTPNSMEADLVPKYDIDISFIPVTGLRGKGVSFLLKAPWRLTVSLVKAIHVLRIQKPVCVIGMGGYAAGPGGIAARLLGIPLVVHEQNAVAGLTNKLLARVANRVLEAFPDTFRKQPTIARKTVLTGNPVRSDITAVTVSKPHNPLRLLVIGGSRGALAINELMPELIERCGDRMEVWHQTGKASYKQCLTEYQKLGLSGDTTDCRVVPFIDDMAQAYAWADLVLCRSGALTIAEMAAAGKPSILIPFPHAVDDHQTINGQYLVKQGAALMIQQHDLNIDVLTKIVVELMDDPAQLDVMACSAKSAALPQATADVVRNCLEAAGREISYA